jgi:dTDP-4-dehydrorhamnose 3,5-epimerase
MTAPARSSASLEPLGIEGAWLHHPRIHADHRGRMLQLFTQHDLERATGRPFPVAQANCAVTRQGAIRGIHYADVPPGQAKFVTCVSGEILDVIVDLRVGSPTFGRWEAVRLDDRHRQAVYLAEGLGHGLTALSPEATVVYLCSTPYAPEREHGVSPFDPDLAITWPAGTGSPISERDSAAPTLAQAAAEGHLPIYEECRVRAGRGEEVR